VQASCYPSSGDGHFPAFSYSANVLLHIDPSFSAASFQYPDMEAIGLVLNIAPLLIELWKANPETVNALQAISRDNTRNMIEEFYDGLHYELSILKLNLSNLVKDLPVDQQLKDKLDNDTNLDAAVWRNPQEELQLALQRRLGPGCDSFMRCMESILKLLAKLVDDKSLPISLTEEDIVCYAASYSILLLTDQAGFFQTILQKT
jgi:hypothetical protein